MRLILDVAGRHPDIFESGPDVDRGCVLTGCVPTVDLREYEMSRTAEMG